METTGLLAARAAAYLALLLVAGVPLHALAAGQVLAFRARLVLALLAIVAAFASAWWALESVAAMAGITLAELDQATAEVVLAQTPLGKVMEWRLTALAAVFLACFVPLRVEDFPEELREDFREIMAMLTRKEPHFNWKNEMDYGSIHMTLLGEGDGA